MEVEHPISSNWSRHNHISNNYSNGDDDNVPVRVGYAIITPTSFESHVAEHLVHVGAPGVVGGSGKVTGAAGADVAEQKPLMRGKEGFSIWAT